jgi:hypothetical protein
VALLRKPSLLQLAQLLCLPNNTLRSAKNQGGARRYRGARLSFLSGHIIIIGKKSHKCLQRALRGFFFALKKAQFLTKKATFVATLSKK